MGFADNSRGSFRKLLLLFRRDRFRSELTEEMAFHRVERQQELEAAGMTPKQRRTARQPVSLAICEQLKERSTEAVGFRFESVMQDLRFAIRQLKQNPGFTIVITLTLGLSIGANSAIFSVIDAVLLKPLPYPDADRLQRIFLSNFAFPQFPLNPWDFRDFRSRNTSFESFAAYTRSDVQLSGSGEPVRLNGFNITSGYFHTLGLRPQLGREFDVQAEIPGSGKQVIVSDRLWRSRFATESIDSGPKNHARHAAVHGSWRHAARRETSRQRLSRHLLWRQRRCLDSVCLSRQPVATRIALSRRYWEAQAARNDSSGAGGIEHHHDPTRPRA